MSKQKKKRSGKGLATAIIMVSFVLVILALGVSFRNEILGAFGLDKSSQAMSQTTIENKKFELLSTKATLYESFDDEITIGEGNKVNFLVRYPTSISVFQLDFFPVTHGVVLDKIGRAHV